MEDDTILQKIFEMDRRLAEDALYETVVTELKNGWTDIVAEARAMEEAQGEKEKARAFYIKHRIRRLKDAHLADIIDREAQKEADKAKSEELKSNIERKRQENENRNYLIKKVLQTKKVNSVVKRAYQNEFEEWFRGRGWRATRNSAVTNNDLWLEFFREYLEKLEKN